MAVCVGLSSVPACFFDSRWGEPKRLQEAAARRATPKALRATPEGDSTPHAALRVLHLRAHATPRFLTEVSHGERRFEETVSRANAILGPTLQIRLEVSETLPWSPRADEGELQSLLPELALSDPGKDVDWVVGLVGSSPKLELDFRELGRSNQPGKHLVLRAMNDAREYDDIATNLSELPENERRSLYRARLEHKTTVVFLHELGHSLGAPHEVAKATIMHPIYGTDATELSGPAVGLMRLTLEQRLAPESMSEAELARAVLEHVSANQGTWLPEERDELVARYQRATNKHASTPAPPPEPTRTGPTRAPVAAQAPVAAPEALAGEDRARFERASQAFAEKRLGDAWQAIAPLVDAYPSEPAVQDLRCQIAMQIGGSYEMIESNCRALLPGPKKR